MAAGQRGSYSSRDIPSHSTAGLRGSGYFVLTAIRLYNTSANTQCIIIVYYSLLTFIVTKELLGKRKAVFLPALCVHVQRSVPPRCIYYRPSSILAQKWDPALRPHYHIPHTVQCPKSWESADRTDGYIRCTPYLGRREIKRLSEF